MNTLEYLILFPIIIGLVLFLIPEEAKAIKGLITLCISIVIFYFSIGLYTSVAIEMEFSSLSHLGINSETLSQINRYLVFQVDGLTKLIVLFVSFFTMVITVYSITFIGREKGIFNYYAYLLLTLGASNGAVLANNLLLFLLFWGFLGISLYKLINSHDTESASAANKSLILIGGSDALMMFGIVLLWRTQGTLNMSELSVSTSCAIEVIAFLTLLIGSFTKAGAFPFHSWIPEYTKKAPASSSALLPASLDKLVGIYFMARIFNEIFILNQWLTLIVITLGAFTIIIAVMMALVQKNYKKLLGYHAVSQVGYMVVGLGLGTVLGLVGGLFHMINNALYKSGLFLTAGNVKMQTGKDKLGDLGGLSKAMPITFFTALIFALSISGIPPFNGFASKWIIYQGIIEFGREAGIANSLWVVWLAMAVIGSALTLASFIKFIAGIFLGRKKMVLENVKESNIIMLIPLVVIAILCVGFGVFATRFIVPLLFERIVGQVDFIGGWSSGLISILILASILLGILIYAIGSIKHLRSDDSFIGGETFQESTNHSVTEFYYTISNFKIISGTYDKARKKWFDIYYLSKNGGLLINRWLKKAHNGILLNYAVWFVVGLIVMLIFFNVI